MMQPLGRVVPVVSGSRHVEACSVLVLHVHAGRPSRNVVLHIGQDWMSLGISFTP
jgi:hypothetical protein